MSEISKLLSESQNPQARLMQKPVVLYLSGKKLDF